jgi:glyceraldehyde-3-phosphate dehydrogenase/erythrose-4-phosphate dehydrogenase
MVLDVLVVWLIDLMADDKKFDVVGINDLTDAETLAYF